MKGMPIFSARYLITLAEEKKAIHHYHWGIRPAAFMIQQPFIVIMGMLRNSTLSTIEPLPEHLKPKKQQRIFRNHKKKEK